MCICHVHSSCVGTLEEELKRGFGTCGRFRELGAYLDILAFTFDNHLLPASTRTCARPASYKKSTTFWCNGTVTFSPNFFELGIDVFFRGWTVAGTGHLLGALGLC
jgi:hypothetical protein